MRNVLRILLVAMILPGCSADRAARAASSALPAPIATASHPYAGFWKDRHCEDAFGQAIAPAGPNLYSVSFCGPVAPDAH